ncbi:MAG: molybdopterin-dependent oxidoreductase [Chloroflexi bacterium]|nr:molybdopterin-dependent oxidoreductase [Chloroflexota bacterium]
MEVTRRNFLKAMGTVTLGTVVFNACRWPEEELLVQSPWEIPEDMVSGVDTFYATQCGQCPDGAGVVVRVVEGRAKKIEGNPDFPLNRGKHSARCEAGLQALYHPDRIQTPLRRSGERGSGQFTPISWDEAHQELVRELRSRNASQVVLVTQPLPGHLGKVVHDFAKAYGGQHIQFEPLERTVLRRAVKEVFGQDRLPDFDIGKAQYVLSFGADFLGTWVSPVRHSIGYGEFRQGEGRRRGTLVQVDSHFSLTTANADEWVYVRPGTEGILALSIAHVIVSEGLGDRAAADALTGGAGAQALDAFRPQRAEQLTGVPAAKVLEIARAFAANRPSLALGGDSPASHTNGLFNLIAIYSLNYLVGSVGKEGGVIFNPASPLAVPDSSSTATLKEWQGLVERMRRGEVSAAVVRGANPVHGLPAATGFGEAFRQVPYIVGFATVMDETSALADLVLPDTTYLEEWGSVVPDPGPGHEVVGFQQPVVRPLYQARSFGDELLSVSQELGLELAQGTMREFLLEGAGKLQGLPRGSVRSATVEGFWKGVLQRGGWWDVNAKANGDAPRPPRLPTQEKLPSYTGSPTEFPFSLTVFRSLSLAEGQNAHLPWLQALPDPLTTVVWRTWVEVNTRTAAQMGLKLGDMVEVVSPQGRIMVPVYPHPAVHPDAVAIPLGQGHTAYGRYAQDRGANVLSILAPAVEGETGALAWGATRVRLVKTGESIDLAKFEGMVPAFPVSEEEAVIQITTL